MGGEPQRLAHAYKDFYGEDLAPAEGSTPVEEINAAPFDATEIYYNYNTVRDFWQQLG